MPPSFSPCTSNSSPYPYSPLSISLNNHPVLSIFTDLVRQSLLLLKLLQKLLSWSIHISSWSPTIHSPSMFTATEVTSCQSGHFKPMLRSPCDSGEKTLSHTPWSPFPAQGSSSVHHAYSSPTGTLHILSPL